METEILRDISANIHSRDNVKPPPPLPPLPRRPTIVSPAKAEEYTSDIVHHLREREATSLRLQKGPYFGRQPELSERMRLVVIDWLIDVAAKFRVHPETYFLAVELLDAYLCVASVARRELQLVAIASMWIAAKHEEVYPPEIGDCVYICANTYTKDEVIRAERSMAVALQFQFTIPTPYHFASHIISVTSSCNVAKHLTFLFLEASAAEAMLLVHPPSMVAAAAAVLARYVIDDGNLQGAGSATFLSTAGYALADLTPVANTILGAARALLCPTSKYVALRRKYAHPTFSSVAMINLPEVMTA